MGMSSITYDLPNTYTIGNLEPMDAQLLVYSKIIEKIEAIGLKVSISINPATDISTLEISWPSQLDSAEKTRMRNIILSHLKK